MDSEGAWRKAIEQTFVVKFPKQHLATFGITNISYYVVTEPVFAEETGPQEGVVRSGRVVAQKPTIVTPTYAMHLDGFSPEAYEYFADVANEAGPNSPGILYQYKNEEGAMDIVSGFPQEIAHRIRDDLESRDENMSVVIVGVDELWDVSLLKFIYEFTSSSAETNARELNSRGLLAPEPSLNGAPRAAVDQIEKLFREVGQGRDPEELKRELDRWGLFDFYQDRFLALYRR